MSDSTHTSLRKYLKRFRKLFGLRVILPENGLAVPYDYDPIDPFFSKLSGFSSIPPTDFRILTKSVRIVDFDEDFRLNARESELLDDIIELLNELTLSF